MNKKSKKSFDYLSDEEEVLAFDDDDDSDDDKYDEEKYNIEDEDDEEENEEINEDEELISSAWGSKKSSYYSGNRIENDEDAELEEEEARMLQSKMMNQLDTDDFGLDAFKNQEKKLKTSDELVAEKTAQKALGGESEDEIDKNLEKISKNLEKMSQKEKIEFLRQESPELFELVRDFKEKMDQLKKTLLPIYRLVKNGRIPSSLATDFIVNKTKLFLMYSSHLSFYFAMKSQRFPIDNHPIVKNILQFRNLCKQIAPVDENLDDEIKFLIDSIENDRQLIFKKNKQEPVTKRTKKSVKFTRNLAREDRNKLVYDDGLESDTDQEIVAKHEEITDEGPNADKRAINYEIMKNKGLTPKRDKMYRNPRVRNRLKSRKAMIKHKSIVPKVRTQDKRYAGEATGIRTNVVRAVKIK